MLATTSAPAHPDANKAPEKTSGPAVLVPFVRASDEHLQPGNIDSSALMTTSATDRGVFDIPAFGHIRWLYLLVEATGGAGAGVTGTEDAPWNAIQNFALTEPNGAYIVQLTNLYEGYQINKLGGYLPAISADPKESPAFSAIAAGTGNFSYLLRIPVEISGRDGVGSLPNQDSAGQFKVRFTVAPSATVYSVAPTTLPTIRVRAWLSAWEQPEPQSGGMANAVSPPASGTTSFWSVQSGITVNAGENTIELKRKGNYLRQLIFILRRAGTSRANGQSDWPAETRFLRDAFPARYFNDLVWRHKMFEISGRKGTIETAGGLDNGVRFLDYAHEFDGELGRENRDLWQPTRGSTRLEIAGNFANAGTLTVITNDVAIAENVFL